MSTEPGVIFEEVDEELLLFDSLTWQTHLLNATAAELVRLIAQGAISTRDLAESLMPGDTDFRQEVETLLQSLADLGLVKCVDS